MESPWNKGALVTNVLNYFAMTLHRGTQNSSAIIVIAAWASLIGHPLYWAIWTYFMPQPYESAVLRFGSAALAIGLFLRASWPPKLQKYFPLYWHFFVLIVVPVLFTFLALKNNFNPVWTLCHLGMIFLMILLIREVVWFILLLIIGTLLGAVLYWANGGSFSEVSISAEYLAIMLFAIFVCIPFLHAALKGTIESEGKIEAEKHRVKAFKALSGNIAHEVRNPVSSAHGAIAFIRKSLVDLDALKAVGDEAGYQKKLARIERIAGSAYDGLKRGDFIIQVILKNIREEEIDPATFKTLSVKTVVEKTLEEYAFQGQESTRVNFESEPDFMFKGDENLLIYALFNLLKNALYYLPDNPDSDITITRVPGRDVNRLLFKDTGPGIPEKALPRIFKNFATYEKVGGTGLGLPFCKRIMRAMGGDITCNSKQGEGAEFVLSFPVIDKTGMRL